MIRNQLVDLIENTFRSEEVLYLACNEERAFFDSEEHKKYDLWSCQKVTDALIYLLDNIYIRFGSKLNRQNVGIPMGTNCAPLVADLFLFCYERDFMKSLTKEKRYDLIDAFNSSSRYLDDLLNIDNIHFEHMVHRIYPAELQLNKANVSDTEAAFLDLNLSIHNDILSTKIYYSNFDKHKCTYFHWAQCNEPTTLTLGNLRCFSLISTKFAVVISTAFIYRLKC